MMSTNSIARSMQWLLREIKIFMDDKINWPSRGQDLKYSFEWRVDALCLLKDEENTFLECFEVKDFISRFAYWADIFNCMNKLLNFKVLKSPFWIQIKKMTNFLGQAVNMEEYSILQNPCKFSNTEWSTFSKWTWNRQFSINIFE